MSARLPFAHRLWRALPQRQRRTVATRAAALFAPRIAHMPLAPSSGVVVAGELTRASGLGEAARLVVRAARLCGIRTWALDVGTLLPAHHADLAFDCDQAAAVPPDAALLIHVNAPWLPLVLGRLGRGFLGARRVVGCWAWELEATPPEWRIGARFAHEAWAPSAFAAAAFAKLTANRVRTVPLPLAADPPVPSAVGRADFGLPEHALVVLVAFNLASSFARKNPLGAIAAFRAAFGERRDRLLLLKVGNPAHAPEDFASLQAAVAGARNIRIETRTFPRAVAAALTATADIVLSLHRSEGFGLVPAEAMMLARPVVATGWSGTMSFMDADTAALVPYRLVPAEDPRAVYSVPGTRWAEPDIAAAAEWLQRLADDPALRVGLGLRAQTAARARLGTAPLAAALTAIGAGPGQ
ncbi:MAG TPA: glycosyltransferase [Acetobacteraceae bacterium]|nr:glycosyltransferase [Acetobacteraceae bacterium]